MAWPDEAGILGIKGTARKSRGISSRSVLEVLRAPVRPFQPQVIQAYSRRRKISRRREYGLYQLSSWRGEHVFVFRGKYRIFNTAEYRYFWGSVPPVPGDPIKANSSTLPFTTVDTFGDGSWYLSVSRFNGVLDSGFLQLGASDETYLRIDINVGGEILSPPQHLTYWHLEKSANGVVRIVSFYAERGDNRGSEFSIAYTIDGSIPDADSPDFTTTIKSSGTQKLVYDLPAQADGVTVTVRLQVRRNDGTVAVPDWHYSETGIVDPYVKSIEADAQGALAPSNAELWPGRVPEEV